MKNFLVGLFTVICLCFAAGSIVYASGAIDLDEISYNRSTDGTAAFYVRFMDDYFLLDKNGFVLGTSLNEPDDIPEIENLLFSNLTVGKTAEADDEDDLDYVMEVCSLLREEDISVSEIYVEDGEITLYLASDLSVMLGDDEDTDVKISDLKSLYSDLMEYSGVLYMQEADTDGSGYTFKVSSGS